MAVFTSESMADFKRQRLLNEAASDLLEALEWIVRVNDAKGSSLSVALIDKAKGAINKAHHGDSSCPQEKK